MSMVLQLVTKFGFLLAVGQSTILKSCSSPAKLPKDDEGHEGDEVSSF